MLRIALDARIAVKIDDARRFIVLCLGHGRPYIGVLLRTAARSHDVALAVRAERLHDAEDLLLRLALAVDDLGEALPDLAGVIHLRVAHILEGRIADGLDCLLLAHAPLLVFRQQCPDFPFRHAIPCLSAPAAKKARG